MLRLEQSFQSNGGINRSTPLFYPNFTPNAIVLPLHSTRNFLLRLEQLGLYAALFFYIIFALCEKYNFKELFL